MATQTICDRCGETITPMWSEVQFIVERRNYSFDLCAGCLEKVQELLGVGPMVAMRSD